MEREYPDKVEFQEEDRSHNISSQGPGKIGEGFGEPVSKSQDGLFQVSLVFLTTWEIGCC
jgi:hypothetical protein